MNTSSSDQNKKTVKRSSWRWWQPNKSPDQHHIKDCASSLAPSSLVVHHSIHSKESIEILSTASIKSKPWISQKLKSTSISPEQQQDEECSEEEVVDHNTVETLQPENKSETNARRLKSTNSESHVHSKEAVTPSSASFLNDVPSITSSTIPVMNFNPNERNKKGSDATVFSGIRAKLGRWVSKTDK